MCGANDSSFQCDGSTSTFRVMFKEPVEIQPNTNYTACATLKVFYTMAVCNVNSITVPIYSLIPTFVCTLLEH